METIDPQKLVTLSAKAEMLFSTITVVPNAQDTYVVPLKVSGYHDLVCLTADLMKLCVLALQTDEPHISALVQSGKINVGNILEVALQLMPYDEAEFLDTVLDLTKDKPA